MAEPKPKQRVPKVRRSKKQKEDMFERAVKSQTAKFSREKNKSEDKIQSEEYTERTVSYGGVKKVYKVRKRINEELTSFERGIVELLRQNTLSEAEQATAADGFRSVIQFILEDREAAQQLTAAPLLWKDRDKSLGQQPHEFIQATYFDAGHNVDRATLRKLDRTLLLSLERQERDPEKAPPQDFLDRFPRKGQQIDAEIAKVKETGDRPESWREQHRLRQAARRRGITLGKE